MTIGLSLGVMLPCQPVDKFWNTMKPGSCASLGPYYFAQVGIHYKQFFGGLSLLHQDQRLILIPPLAQSALLIATDFAVCLLPLRMIWRVQLPRRQKITLCILFGCGSTACIASVVKLSYMPILLKSDDTSYIGTTPLVWTFVELSIATIAACGPSLKIVVKRIAPRLLGSSNISTDPYPSRGGEGRESTGGAKSLTGHYNSIHMKSLKSQNQMSKKHLSVTETEVGSESTERIIPVTNIMRTMVVRQSIEVEN